VSNSLLGFISKCDISDNLQSSAFDHKATVLQFTGKSCSYSQQCIAGKTIADPDTTLLVHLSTLECYLIYQDRDHAEKGRLLGLIGNARKALKNAGPDPVFYNIDFVDLQDELRRGQQIGLVRAFLDSDEAELITNGELNIDSDLFFEMLLNHVKVDIMSYQIFLVKYLSREKTFLRQKLVELYGNFNVNLQDIADTEKKLQRISEREIELALQNHPVFEHLNGEKMSNHFLKLTKGCKKTDSILQVKDDNGQDHRTIMDCKEFVTGYFEKIYQLPQMPLIISII
jgi:hypothetical protein